MPSPPRKTTSPKRPSPPKKPAKPAAGRSPKKPVARKPQAAAEKPVKPAAKSAKSAAKPAPKKPTQERKTAAVASADRPKSVAAAKGRRYQTLPWDLPRTALPHLRAAHPQLARVIERIGPCTLTIGHAEGPFVSLVRAIVFQQLATKAASTIFGRLRDLFRSDSFPSPAELLAMPDEALRGAGLSGQKLGYLRDLAQRVDRGELDLDALTALPDAEVIAQLTTVRGIGRWSAQMFLIFYLGRLDVWPDGDLGIRHGVRVLHGHAELPPAPLMQQLGQRFSPYASVASWYLWRLLDLPEAERVLLLA